jgi:hypothetical protein
MLLSVWKLRAPQRRLSQRAYRRLWLRAMARSRSRHFFHSVPAVLASVPQILRGSADGNGHPRWAPVRTDAQQRMAPFPQIACLRPHQPTPSLAERRRVSLLGRRRGSKLQRFVAIEQPLRDLSKGDGVAAPCGSRSSSTLHPFTASRASRKPDHGRLGFIPINRQPLRTCRMSSRIFIE